MDCSAFFCSESDVNIFEIDGGNIEWYIDDLLGLDEIDTAISIINIANIKLREKYESFSAEQKNLSASLIDETNKAKEIEDLFKWA